MSSFRKILDFYINSSIHVALAVVSLVLVTLIHFSLPFEIPLLLFSFFGTIVAYNFVKFSGLTGWHYKSLSHKLRAIQTLTFLAFAGLVASLFFLKLKTIEWTVLFLLFTLLYSLPVFTRRRNLRSISGVKIFIIAFVWAGVTVILPVSTSEKALFETPVFIEYIQRFILVLVWILPFEIRDLKFDLLQLGTIPQRVGVTGTKIVGSCMLLLVLLSEFLAPATHWTIRPVMAIMLVITAFFVWLARENQSRYYAAFWVESIPVFWLFLLLVFRML